MMSSIQDGGCSISLGPRVITMSRVPLVTRDRLEARERNKLVILSHCDFEGYFLEELDPIHPGLISEK